jgi:hypothetical protein
MADPDFDETVDVVRGQVSEARADQILRFWSKEGGPEGPAAREQLSAAVCVLVGDGGEVAGVDSVHAEDVALTGGRKFWIYRSLLAGAASDAEPEMINAAFTALEEEFEPNAAGPIGLCLLVAEPPQTQRRPQAIWPETELMFAGYLEDDAQVWIRYFDEAAIGPGLPNSPTLSETRQLHYSLEDRYRIEDFAETAAVSRDDVISLWEREAIVPPGEVERRVDEVHLVAIERTEGLVGISSAYLGRSPRLRMELWYYRAFVAQAHRSSSLAVMLALKGRDLLEQRFVSGEDTRGAGIIYAVENEGLKRYFNKALWLPTEFTFIGESPQGAHVRVHYFPGALVPAPR